MSHFYGTMQGVRGKTTRCGTATSGLQVVAASWSGAIEVTLYQDEDGEDCFIVRQIPWNGHGVTQTIVEGSLIGSPALPKDV